MTRYLVACPRCKGSPQAAIHSGKVSIKRHDLSLGIEGTFNLVCQRCGEKLIVSEGENLAFWEFSKNRLPFFVVRSFPRGFEFTLHPTSAKASKNEKNQIHPGGSEIRK